MLDGEDEKSVTRPPLRTNEEKLAFIQQIAEVFGIGDNNEYSDDLGSTED
jgi:hypothetical protein